MAPTHARPELAVMLPRRPRPELVALLALCLTLLGCTEPPVGTEWERAQARHAKALKAAGHSPAEPAIRELKGTKTGEPELCISCHLGMAPGQQAVESQALFRSHPKVAHAPADYGCVACHGGRADGLSQATAHGRLDNWPEPLLPQLLVEARCGSCHRELAPSVQPGSPGFDAPTLQAGESAFHERGCLGCHRVGEVGGRLARDLTSIGRPASTLLGYGRELRQGFQWTKLHWHFDHPLVVAPLAAVAPMTAGEATRQRALQTYLLSLRDAESGASGEQGARFEGAAAYAAFCSACHGEDAQGRHWPGRSQWAPGLREAGHASLAGRRLMRDAIANGRALSGMPAWSASRGGLSERQIDSIVDWLLSLQPAVPELEALTSLASDAARGLSVYAQSCAACHGERGQGGDFGGSVRGLALPLLHEALTQGQPERGMPPFAALTERDLADLLTLLQDEAAWAAAAAPLPTGAGQADPALLFGSLCASCHGPSGEGREAPSLRSEAWQAAVTDAQITMAILAGRPGARTPSWTHAGDAPLSAREALALTRHLRGFKEPHLASGKGTKR